jgi:DNA-binding transcriptional ArsR family regulator
MWRQQAREAVRDLDLGPMRVLFTSRHTAEILLPPPATCSPRFDDQLAKLAVTPHAWLERDIRRLYGNVVPAGATDYLRSPGAALDRLTRALEKYWARVIGPWWPRLSALLEQDLLYRAQTLTRDTLLAMVNGLHPELRASHEAILCAPTIGHDEATAPSGGIVFVASIFVNGRPQVTVEEWDRTAIYYQARGVGTLGERAGQHHPADAMSVLLSHRRADLVRSIRAPSTPGELAQMLGVTPSAVSQRLAQLKAAGLVNRTQLGRKAYYDLTPNGRALLHVLDQTR